MHNKQTCKYKVFTVPGLYQGLPVSVRELIILVAGDQKKSYEWIYGCEQSFDKVGTTQVKLTESY